MAREGSLTLAPDHCRRLVVHLAERAVNFEIEEKFITAAIRARAGIATEGNAKALSNLNRALIALYDPEADFGASEERDQLEDMQRQLDAIPDEMTVRTRGGRP